MRKSKYRRHLDNIYYLIGSKVFWAIIISLSSLAITIALSPDALEQLRQVYLVIVTNIITVFIVYFIFQAQNYKNSKKKKRK